MAYVGTPLDTTNAFQSLAGKRFSGDASTTDFTLDSSPNSTLDIEVFVDNVRQDPNSAYTVSGTTLAFTAAPPTGTNNIYVVHQAKSVGTIDVPSAGVQSGSLSSAFLTGQTDIGGAIADADLFLVDDGAGGTFRKTAASRIKTYVNYLTKVHTITASDDATVAFNSTYLTSTYKRYTLEMFDIQSASDNVYLELHFSTDNGSAYLTSSVDRINIGTTTDEGNDAIKSRNTTGNNFLQMGGGTNFGTGTGEVGAFTMQLVNFSDTAHYKLLYYTGAKVNSDGKGGIEFGSGAVHTTSAINNIKFQFSSGNITAGTFVLYGVV